MAALRRRVKELPGKTGFMTGQQLLAEVRKIREDFRPRYVGFTQAYMMNQLDDFRGDAQCSRCLRRCSGLLHGAASRRSEDRRARPG